VAGRLSTGLRQRQVGQIVGTYRALGTGTRIRGSGNRRDPRPTESVVSAKFSTATFAQMIDGSSQLALRIVLPRSCGPVRSVPAIAVAGSTRRRSLLEAAEQTSTKMRCRWVRRAIAGPKSRSSGSVGSRGCQGPLDVGSGSGQALCSGRVLRNLRRCVCAASEEVRGAIGLRHGVDLRSTGRA
jgi:hypothetical protein